jgi:hypothetical protein
VAIYFLKVKKRSHEFSRMARRGKKGDAKIALKDLTQRREGAEKKQRTRINEDLQEEKIIRVPFV